ncbi:MoaD/ThiS family protein [Luteococcus peritonei]|uniref:MoaD/ThiS family protein n=1 Tax=Luteococcus peritonei TaxID=88874 RepID=A0ABW4RRL9_9ACTN
MTQVRWFAGAAAAAGTDRSEVDHQPQGTVAAVLATVCPGAAEVLPRCTFLADGARVGGDEPWPENAATLDVLPPFAGG